MPVLIVQVWRVPRSGGSGVVPDYAGVVLSSSKCTRPATVAFDAYFIKKKKHDNVYVYAVVPFSRDTTELWKVHCVRCDVGSFPSMQGNRLWES